MNPPAPVTSTRVPCIAYPPKQKSAHLPVVGMLSSTTGGRESGRMSARKSLPRRRPSHIRCSDPDVGGDTRQGSPVEHAPAVNDHNSPAAIPCDIGHADRLVLARRGA